LAVEFEHEMAKCTLTLHLLWLRVRHSRIHTWQQRFCTGIIWRRLVVQIAPKTKARSGNYSRRAFELAQVFIWLSYCCISATWFPQCSSSGFLPPRLPDPKSSQSYHWWVNPWVFNVGGWLHVSVQVMPFAWWISVTNSIGLALQPTTFFATLGFVGLQFQCLATVLNFSRPWYGLGLSALFNDCCNLGSGSVLKSFTSYQHL